MKLYGPLFLEEDDEITHMILARPGAEPRIMLQVGTLSFSFEDAAQLRRFIEVGEEALAEYRAAVDAELARHAAEQQAAA